ncbi:MAG: AAA family ATPase [Wenzhouxiangellaceae bacterium]|nr:AAA family ATPase [Wenzhouxiangellaceae bacterium]
MNPAAGALEAQKHELAVHIRAGAGLISIETRDEPRALELFRHVSRETLRPLFLWTAARGLRRLDRDSGLDGTFTQALELLRHIDQRRDIGIFILADFQGYLEDPVIVRLMREISRHDDPGGATLVLVGTPIDLPETLRAKAVHYQLSTPSRAELEAMLRAEALAWKQLPGKAAVRIDAATLGRLVENLSGLIMKDARRLARNAIFDDGVLDDSDLPGLMKAKFELLDPGGVLNFELETGRFADVAGIPNLKRWLKLRAAVFGDARPPKGLDTPRGILLLGVQGCGKSLTARSVAGLFKVPLLQLDCGALYNRFHGESERNMRESLKSAERMAPCVLWIDEIEKGLATGSNDGGTSRRMLATLLTWMSEHESRVFIVATANDISALPPELVRKGRFDEIFFVDLPDHATRAQVLAIHLQRRGLKSDLYDLDALAGASDGFSGSELEHAIVSGLYAAHAAGTALGNAQILEEIRATRPLSVVMAEPIQSLRRWAESRTVKA